jgi:GNAT superfamily N-acetyltransferase
MEQVSVRQASLDDLDLLLSFEQAIIETERPFDETLRPGPNVHYYDLAELISSPDAEVVVAEVDSRVVGSGYARIETSKPYVKHARFSYLGFMYVVPEHRGRGINKRIVDALEAWSLSKGVTEMRLEVYAVNAAAVRAYEKSGYSSLILLMRKGLDETDK